jgi:hypothetical protein
MATTRTERGASRSQLGGAVDVAAAALAGGLRTVAGVHAAIARKPFAALRPVPAVGAASVPVRLLHDGITALVYAGIADGLALLGAAARVAVAALPDREPLPGSLVGTAAAALNGFAGDRLARDGNPLATTMSLRHDGRPLAPSRTALAAALPAASPRIVLFVHGLACNETMWWRHAARHYGDQDVSHGSRLGRERGVTPLYLRYNSGLPIADNGRHLARLLDELVVEWPVPIEQLVLVGHSMGGLVLRGAAHHGGAWTRHVRHAFYLGSPHRGAPLEKAADAAAWLLAQFEVTRPFGAALDARSRGVKDLRHGTVCGDGNGALPLLDGVDHHFIVATLTRDPHHPLGAVVGDLLVRPASARGHSSPAGRADIVHLGGLSHLDLLNHPRVYEQLSAVLGRSG